MNRQRPGDVLATTLAATFVPAANLRAHADDVPWAAFLLPSVDPALVVRDRGPAPSTGEGEVVVRLRLGRRAAGRAAQRLWVVSGPTGAHATSYDDRAAMRFLAARLRARPARASGPARRAARSLRGLVRRPRPLNVALDGPGADARRPPGYLRALATSAGTSIDDCRWAMSVPGGYRSKKVVFWLFDDDSPRPSLIVKLTRHPDLNPRLENEWRALGRLVHLELPGLVPPAAFFGHHRRLAVLGQGAVEGRPFREQMTGQADCRLLQAAVEWLIELADATAAPPAEGAAASLGALVERCAALYRLEPAHRRFLEDQVDAVAREHPGLPLVLQHGDPGVWNVLAVGDTGVAFLDWEAAEQHGIPLWDLFYFLRSYAVSAARARRRADALDAFADAFLNQSDLAAVLRDACVRLCRRVGLASSLVEPLFHLCWVHRAVKEVTRLRPERLHEGHYVRLSRLALERRSDVVRTLAAPGRPRR
jgi:hypothetical protein